MSAEICISSLLSSIWIMQCKSRFYISFQKANIYTYIYYHKIKILHFTSAELGHFLGDILQEFKVFPGVNNISFSLFFLGVLFKGFSWSYI